MLVSERVHKLQTLMSANNLDAYVVPSSDPHQSEYVADLWKRREFISGFSGSAGLFAATRTTSGLWTDGRYFIQAEAQLAGTPIELFRKGNDTLDWKEWLIQSLPKGARVGINLELFSIAAFQSIVQSLKNAGLSWVAQSPDLVDEVWGDERPLLPRSPLYEHSLEYAGQSRGDKIVKLQNELSQLAADALIISALDEIAWLFNLRGNDVSCNPVFYAFAIITCDSAKLYVDSSKISPSLHSTLGLEVLPYESFAADLAAFRNGQKIWADPQSNSARVEQILRDAGVELLVNPSPLPQWKAAKNPAEIKGMQNSHRRDGAAMVKFLSWLKANGGKMQWDEITAAEKLESFRKEDKDYLGPSFETISAFGPNGALPHYRATQASCLRLTVPGIYLVDSGGQYKHGTTDITRTVALGHATDKQRFIYTIVLKGHLLLKRSLFPQGVDGYQLDVLARQPLWQHLQDFNHGTGHGVGAALCVHEGPFGISMRKNLTPFHSGNIVSIEPGCYLEGEFGVRIENIVTVIKKGPNSEQTEFLGFDDLTLCPYDKNLIEINILSLEDIHQINDYHDRVYRELSPLLNENQRSDLFEMTAPLMP